MQLDNWPSQQHKQPCSAILKLSEPYSFDLDYIELHFVGRVGGAGIKGL